MIDYEYKQDSIFDAVEMNDRMKVMQKSLASYGKLFV